ncbi:MAG: transcription elongation factor GreB [Myxococcales bacterium]|jgi:transcription elongation factor GreB|nr:transcription elongation factor GreB [Myxococcales bacterium]
MSKAFTKEEDEREDDDEGELGEEASSSERYITPEGFARLRAELDDLWKVQRPKITSEVSAAAAQGDRSENAEYIYGKKKLREIDRRIRYLSKRLDSLTVVDPKTQTQKDKIFFGAWFTIEDEDARQSTYRIVGPDEFDVKAGLISIESPLAKALIGRSVGEDTVVNRPKGEVEIVVLKIWY